MPEIRDIEIRDLNVPDIQPWVTNPPTSIPIAVPVTVKIGVPVVDIPGCVQAHESKNKNKNLAQDDENGVVTYCDGGIPSYNPIDYSPENLTITKPAKVPKVPSPPTPEIPTPEIPTTPPQTAVIKKPVEEVPPEIPWTEEYLPSPGAVTTTASIAVVATTSALMAKPLADLLLKVVKPTVKKVIKKIAAIRGKSIVVESVKDRRDHQRIRSHAIRKLKGKE